MPPFTPKLERIKIQTARMLEIYGLLQRELENNKGLSVSPEERLLLHQAIATIEANMRQLQEYFANHKAENSPEAEEVQELEEIVNAVLEWCISNREGE